MENNSTSPKSLQQLSSNHPEHSYSSPELQMHHSPSYAQPHGQHAEPYRPPHMGPSISHGPVSLPPLRSPIEAPLPHHMAPPHHTPIYMNGPLPPTTTYYSAPPMVSHIPAMHSGIPGNPMGVMRYPLPIMTPSGGMMSVVRHKKEIKRRTKTGCMTCRKRRIKVRSFFKLTLISCLILIS
jgi:hypothetical protein